MGRGCFSGDKRDGIDAVLARNAGPSERRRGPIRGSFNQISIIYK